MESLGGYCRGLTGGYIGALANGAHKMAEGFFGRYGASLGKVASFTPGKLKVLDLKVMMQGCQRALR